MRYLAQRTVSKPVVCNSFSKTWPFDCSELSLLWTNKVMPTSQMPPLLDLVILSVLDHCFETIRQWWVYIPLTAIKLLKALIYSLTWYIISTPLHLSQIQNIFMMFKQESSKSSLSSTMFKSNMQGVSLTLSGFTLNLSPCGYFFLARTVLESDSFIYCLCLDCV